MLNTPITLLEVKLLQKEKTLELQFSNGKKYILPCGYLRANSPSAETRGHFSSKEIMIEPHLDTNIIGIEPVGHYAIKLVFDDGHDTGLYTFEYLNDLGQKYFKA